MWLTLRALCSLTTKALIRSSSWSIKAFLKLLVIIGEIIFISLVWPRAVLTIAYNKDMNYIKTMTEANKHVENGDKWTNTGAVGFLIFIYMLVAFLIVFVNKHHASYWWLVSYYSGFMPAFLSLVSFIPSITLKAVNQLNNFSKKVFGSTKNRFTSALENEKEEIKKRDLQRQEEIEKKRAEEAILLRASEKPDDFYLMRPAQDAEIEVETLLRPS